MTTDDFVRMHLRSLHYRLIGLRAEVVMMDQEPLPDALSMWLKNTTEALERAIVVSGLAGLDLTALDVIDPRD